jgi:acetyltransferase-like isoleucine patch superfamily enzyme
MAQTLLATDRPIAPRRGKSVVKGLAGAVAFVIVLPLVGLYELMVRVFPSRREPVFQGYSQLLSLCPGTTGNYLRRAFYGVALMHCSARCTISFGTIFATPEIEIGDDVYIGAFCNIGHVSIGNDTLIGSNVSILSGKHQHSYELPNVPIRLQGGTYERVHVGDDVWIGNGAIVLTDIDSHAVVGAGAVVTDPVDTGAIVGGNPARVIGQRGNIRLARRT